MKALRFLILLAGIGPLPAVAASETSTPNAAQHGWVEFGLAYSDLSAPQASWKDAYLRGQLQLTPRDSLQGEVSSQSHFDERGTFFGASWTHVFDADWYGAIAAGTSSGGFFLPEARADVALYRKWLPQRNLVTGISVGHYRAKDTHSDNNLVLNAVYYFEGPWIVEGGIRFNDSDPGDVVTARGFAALTWGRNKSRYLILRHDVGREGYQLLGSGSAATNFSSRETTLIWREWLSPQGGINVTAAHYSSPNYARDTLGLGIFHDF